MDIQNYLWVMFVKLVGVGVLTFSLFGLFLEATIGKLFLMTIIVAAVTFIADVFIMPRMNQVVAAIGDFVIYFVLYYVLGKLVVEANVSLLLPVLTAAYFGALAEMVYHVYVMDRLDEEPRTAPLEPGFQMEMSEEMTPDAEERNKQE